MAQIYQVTGGELDGSAMEGPPWYEPLPFRAANGYVFDGSEWRWAGTGENLPAAEDVKPEVT